MGHPFVRYVPGNRIIRSYSCVHGVGTNVRALVHESQTLKKVGRMRYLSLKVQVDTRLICSFCIK